MDSHSYITALGDAFKARREKLALTHETVAERADINVNYYARIERGEINTSVRKLVLIAMALETDVSKLTASAESRLKNRT